MIESRTKRDDKKKLWLRFLFYLLFIIPPTQKNNIYFAERLKRKTFSYKQESLWKQKKESFSRNHQLFFSSL